MQKSCTISLETLLDWKEGRLAPDADAHLRRHLETNCTNCQETLQWLAATLPSVADAAAPVPSPSADALAYANGLARLLRPADAPEANTGVIETVRRHIAHLVEGTRPRPVAAFGGARGGTVPAMQRVFETEAYVINLWDEPEENGDNRYLIGQVYARGASPNAALPFRSAVLLPVSDTTEQQAEREGSEFHFARVVPGVYLVRCLLESDEIFLPQVAVGQA